MKILISCAPDHRMKKKLVGRSHIYTLKKHAFIDSKLYGKATFIWQMLAHVYKSHLVLVYSNGLPSDGLQLLPTKIVH